MNKENELVSIEVIALILPLLFIFLSFPISHPSLKIFVIVFPGTSKARIFKAGIQTDNGLL